MDWIDAKTVYTIFHIFGAVIGAGGAYMSDVMFFSSVKDRVINKLEIRFMKIGSTFVWIGLGLLFVSGILLFLTDPAGYSSSSKFLIKMFIVLIVFINGVIFHFQHLPLINRHTDHHYPSSDEFIRKKKFLIISGVISITSWTFALILGGLHAIPISFITALTLYITIEIIVVSVALLFSKRFF